MGSLADFSSAGASLPWLWIIEYLASFKEVDVSILHDLIETAPELPDDLAKSTREMVALRCLEDLFSPSDKLNSDDLTTSENKIEFALSESCEDVLQHILQETSASDLKMGGPELLKWDVHPFIMHKRASLPKCALQQLKDTILGETNPLAVSLKDISGLMCVNECDGAIVGDLEHNVRAMAEKENLLPSTCETKDRMLGDDLHGLNVSPSKRDRNDMAAGNMAGQSKETLEEFVLNHDNKKLKQDAVGTNQPADQISVPLCGKETVESLSGRVDLIIGGESHGTAEVMEDSQSHGTAEVEDSQLPEDGCDNHDNLRKPWKNSDINDDQIQNNQVEDGQDVQNATMTEAIVTDPRSSTEAPSVGTQRKETVDESKGKMDHSHGEVSSDNDEYLNDRIDVATKKSHFLSSQCSLGYDSLAVSGWTEQNLCVKCNKDGQLLVCSTSSCPLVVHENCLGFPAKFDEKENFHCPFCAYSLAISDYLEAKKKASLARKELVSFNHLESHPKELSDIVHRKDHSHSRSNGDKDIHENGQLDGNNQENQNAQSLDDVNDHLCQKGKGKKKQSEPAASCVNGNSTCREGKANEISGRACISNQEKLTEENMVEECQSERDLEGQQDQTSSNPASNDDNRTCTNIDVAPMNHTEADGEIQKKILPQGSNVPPERPVFALNVDGEENSEHDKFIISNYSIRFRRRETHYTYPAIPQLRRKKVPWTSKEEEMLKKGVRKFANADDKNIPWKKILDYGSSVFLSGRTAIDLKDKWRNMCKGSPRSK